MFVSSINQINKQHVLYFKNIFDYFLTPAMKKSQLVIGEEFTTLFVFYYLLAYPLPTLIIC